MPAPPLANPTAPTRRQAIRLILAGRVQGLGVRPALFRLATELGLAGRVTNTPRGVEIELEGGDFQLARFAGRLARQLPPGADLDRLETEHVAPRGDTRFRILRQPADGPLTARVPVDLAVCPDCLQEVFRPAARRYRYPFTSCTVCGPRYTIVGKMPYERPDTTMAGFAFCTACRTEYEAPGDRRFHAQTNACHVCGPRIWCADRHQRVCGRGQDATRVAVRALSAGHIVGLRGLGGYQLLVDAANEEAVRRLRARKHRRGKPLAVLVPSLQCAHRLARLERSELAALVDPSNPIVLARARGGSELAGSIHPYLDTVGLMLPTTPLHAILARDFGRALVCTSGNREGDPLEREIDGAERNLAGLCDLWLHHDRPIARALDDSVVRVIADRRVTIRLARGLSPLPLDLPPGRPTFALGGYLKCAAAWSNGTQAVLGPHMGDQQTLAARQRYIEHYLDSKRLYRFEPEQLVHDLHPGYFTTQWASEQTLPLVAVQHHHAHVVAGMLQHGWLDREVLGVSWDGTGYAADGTIWGGELLLCTATTFRRFARLRPFRLPGGEAAIHEPWRTAVAIAAEAVGNHDAALLRDGGLGGQERAVVEQILGSPQLSPWTTSAGRLFDAAAALVLRVQRAEFDGQPAMMLEAAADRGAKGRYDFPLGEGPVLQWDWRPLFAGLLADRAAGAQPGTLSMRFHRTLAAGICEACRRRAALPVVLAGGVFQNRLLTELVVELLAGTGQPLGLPGVIPPNDGGLAAGQLAVALFRGQDKASGKRSGLA